MRASKLTLSLCLALAVESCNWGFQFLQGDDAGDGDGDGTSGAGGDDSQGDGDGGDGDGDGDGDNTGGGDGMGGASSPCDGAGFTEWFEDADGDGSGDPAVSQMACEQPTGFVPDGTDCAVLPGADPDCNGLDGDACSSAYSGFDRCDGADNDCDGDTDEDCFATLPVSSGLVLWLDAADASTYDQGTRVGLWRDKSGEGNDAVQGSNGKQPRVSVGALGGSNTFSFDGVNDSLVVDNADGDFDPSNMTIMLVAIPRWTADPGGNPSPFAIRGDNSGATRISLHLEGELMNFHSFNAVVQVFSFVTLFPSEPYLFEYNWAGGAEDHYLNGMLTSSTAHAFGPSTLQPVRIGAAQDDLEHFEGDIGEVIVYSRTLLGTERDDLEAYIQSKWGIDTSP